MVGPQEYCFGQTKNETDEVTDVLFCYYKASDVRLVVYPIGKLPNLNVKSSRKAHAVCRNLHPLPLNDNVCFTQFDIRHRQINIGR